MNENLNLVVLNARIDAALAALHEKTPRARTRRIERGDYVAHLTRALSLAQSDDVCLKFAHVGGFVPNSYGYRAECDRIEVTVGLTDGTAHVTAYRATAQSRPRGYGFNYSVRLLKDGQAQGRYTGW